MPKVVALLCALGLAIPSSAQEKPEKFSVFVTGLDTAVPVVRSLTKLLNQYAPFEAVGKNDASKVVVLVTCMDRKAKEPFVCMYVSHYNGAAFKTFIGGGLFASVDADLLAKNFLRMISEDILERFNDADTENLRAALQACLLLTDTKCNVPAPLQKEFEATQLTLGQYLVKRSSGPLK